MTSTFFVLLILIAVVFSVLVHHHAGFLPLPLCFIAAGLVLSLFPLYHNYIFDPALFLFFIVAPLLYNEAQSASRYWIGRGAINIVSLSILLVITTVVVVGAALHSLFAFLPLSLAFALCAIVTPTDASAVSAFAKPNPDLSIPFTILQNESLFNDASGFVAFDLALLAFTTGTFSATNAFSSFFVQFIGGLLCGAIIGALFYGVRQCLIIWGDDSPFVMIALELLVPFLVYFTAEHFDLSGILAVVAAGIVQGLENDHLQLISTRMQLVRSNIWDLVEEGLTGIVFIFLGISLPAIVAQIILKRPGFLWVLLLIGLSLYGLKFLIRLLWARYLVWMHVSRDHRWQDSLLIAVSGASGTISLSLAFLLPTISGAHVLIDRNALIFIVAVVILLSLTVAAITVPRMTALPPEEVVKPMSQWTREMVMVAMNTVRSDTDHPAETQIVLDALSQQLHQNARLHRRQRHILYEYAAAAEHDAIEKLYNDEKISHSERKYYHQFIDLNLLSADTRPWKNIWLRLRFSINMTRYQNVTVGQNVFFTTPVITEQRYWQKQFDVHGEDIRPIEEAGFQAVMKALKRYRRAHGGTTSVELHAVQRFYRERHRRMTMPEPDARIVYQLFLTAFHAEYEYFQTAITRDNLSLETAQHLQQHIIFDEMAYIQNNDTFIR
ncbi:cation:proton antiporter [Furfurilactobacillus entadae]|uniref:cation:proton antiporter n=1 Tax=Furfurilactobacillus entadae TaxID=2922307 RepID=UPI0035EB29FD